MKTTTRMFVLQDKSYDGDYDVPELEKAIRDAGGELVRAAHSRMVVTAPLEVAEEVKELLEEEIEMLRKDCLRVYDLPDESSLTLRVEFFYPDESQTCSANVDAARWTAMLMADPYDFKAKNDAFVALYQDVEIESGYSPGKSFDVESAYCGELLWSAEMVKWLPETWDMDEPMAQVTFTALARLAEGGDLVAVQVPGHDAPNLSWTLPVRLVGEPDPRKGYDGLLSMPGAPDIARRWARIAPFAVEVEALQPASELTM